MKTHRLHAPDHVADASREVGSTEYLMAGLFISAQIPSILVQKIVHGNSSAMEEVEKRVNMNCGLGYGKDMAQN